MNGAACVCQRTSIGEELLPGERHRGAYPSGVAAAVTIR